MPLKHKNMLRFTMQDYKNVMIKISEYYTASTPIIKKKKEFGQNNTASDHGKTYYIIFYSIKITQYVTPIQ